VLNLVDHYGASFVVVVLAFAELATFSFIYGVDRLCKDIGERGFCDREITYAIKYSFP
jgi:hypothetical protein